MFPPSVTTHTEAEGEMGKMAKQKRSKRRGGHYAGLFLLPPPLVSFSHVTVWPLFVLREVLFLFLLPLPVLL